MRALARLPTAWLLLAVCWRVASRAAGLELPPGNAAQAAPALAARPGRIVVPLQRQRLPVLSDAGILSYKSIYFGSVSVGAPAPQKFLMVFDTGSGHVVLPGKSCRTEACVVHSRYDVAASPTGSEIDFDGAPIAAGAARDQLTVAYGTGEITGLAARDIFCLGVREGAPETAALEAAGVASGPAAGEAAPAQANGTGNGPAAGRPAAAPQCVDMRLVVATEMSHEPFHLFSFDGVAGLGLDALAIRPEFSLFGMLVAQGRLQSPLFGVFLADSHDEESEISFGGVSPVRVQGEVRWAPVAMPEEGHWQVSISRVRIGNQAFGFCEDGECRAVIDTGTSLLVVPSAVHDDLFDALDGSVQDPHDSAPLRDGEVDCRFATGLPIHFEINGFSVTLQPGDYTRASAPWAPDEGPELQADVLQNATDQAEPEGQGSGAPFGEAVVPDGPMTCMPSMMPLDLPPPLGPKLFILGEPVLRKYYTVYDWATPSVGFALAAHSGGAMPPAMA